MTAESSLPSRQPAANVAPMISLDNVSISYRTHTAVRNVSLTVQANSIAALIGPSGCGKTSLLMCLNRLTDLIPHCSVTGSARLGSTEIFDRRTDVVQLRRRVGMIFQRPNPFPMSINRNLALPLREHGQRDSAVIARQIEQALRDVALWDEVKDRLHASALLLSGGQQQRLCIARALVLRPQVLLLDEPCSSLDPISAGTVEDLILQLRHDYTLLVVTHNLGQAKRLADTVGVMWAGRDAGSLVEYGPAAQIFESPQEELTAAYVAGRVG